MSGTVTQETSGKKKVGKSCANGHPLIKVLKWSVCADRACTFFGSTGSALKGLDDEIRRQLRRQA